MPVSLNWLCMLLLHPLHLFQKESTHLQRHTFSYLLKHTLTNAQTNVVYFDNGIQPFTQNASVVYVGPDDAYKRPTTIDVLEVFCVATCCCKLSCMRYRKYAFYETLHILKPSFFNTTTTTTRYSDKIIYWREIQFIVQ